MPAQGFLPPRSAGTLRPACTCKRRASGNALLSRPLPCSLTSSRRLLRFSSRFCPSREGEWTKTSKKGVQSGRNQEHPISQGLSDSRPWRRQEGGVDRDRRRLHQPGRQHQPAVEQPPAGRQGPAADLRAAQGGLSRPTDRSLRAPLVGARRVLVIVYMPARPRAQFAALFAVLAF